MRAIILLSGFVEPLGLTEQNTGADAVIAKSSNEPAHLVRSVKRLVNRALRKPPARKRASRRALKPSASNRKSVTLEVWCCSLVLV